MAVIDVSTANQLFSAYKSGDTDIETVRSITNKVNSFLDAVTFGRASGELDANTKPKVDNCASEMVSFLAKEMFDPEISSESVADWSRTMAHSEQTSQRQEMFHIAQRWLADTGLMYCGV